MPQNKTNNPEGKNQYTGSGPKKPLITGALAKPPVNEGGYGSLSDIQQKKKEFDKAEYKRMTVQDEATDSLIKNFGVLRGVTGATAMIVGGSIASGIKASGLGLKDISHQDIWSNSRTFAVVTLSSGKEKQELHNKFYEKAKAAKEVADEAEKRYVRTLTKF